MRFDLEQHREMIEALCRQYAVKKLEIFGSATRDDFDAERSDADFIVEFEDLGWRGSFKRYMNLKFALEALLDRPVDLVVAGAIRNPYFLAEIQRERQIVYAA